MTSRDNQRWLQLWRNQDIAFHQLAVNQLLERFWADNASVATGTVFVPLCGKSLDMLWLAEQGYDVVGVELSPVAVKAFFEECGLEVSRERLQQFTLWTSSNIRIFCGDYFALQAADLGHIDRVYDRAALTALPAELRADYVSQMKTIISDSADIFLLTIEDCETEMMLDGVIDQEINALYSNCFTVSLAYTQREQTTVSVASESIHTEFKLYYIEHKLTG